MEKLKQLFEKFKLYAKNNTGVTILIGVVFVFLIFTFAYLFNSKNISSIEEKAIIDNSKELVNYLEDIVDSKSKNVDKYILFSLDYSYNVNSKSELTVDEIYDFLSEHFTMKVKKDDIKNIGITPLLQEHNVTYDFSSNSYKLNKLKLDNTTIASTPIKYYKLESISRINKKKYVATYTTYTITDPYKMLNYYIEKNQNSDGKEVDGVYTYELKDLVPIRNYLSGNGKINSLKNSIDKDVSKYAKKGKKVKITYVNKDDKILISKIK